MRDRGFAAACSCTGGVPVLAFLVLILVSNLERTRPVKSTRKSCLNYHTNKNSISSRLQEVYTVPGHDLKTTITFGEHQAYGYDVVRPLAPLAQVEKRIPGTFQPVVCCIYQ